MANASLGAPRERDTARPCSVERARTTSFEILPDDDELAAAVELDHGSA